MHFLPFLQFESVLSATCHLLFCFLVILKKSVFHYLKTYPYFSMVLLPSLSPDLLSPHLSAWAVSSNFSHPKTQLHSSSHHLTIYVYQLVFSFKMDNKNFLATLSPAFSRYVLPFRVFLVISRRKVQVHYTINVQFIIKSYPPDPSVFHRSIYFSQHLPFGVSQNLNIFQLRVSLRHCPLSEIPHIKVAFSRRLRGSRKQ